MYIRIKRRKTTIFLMVQPSDTVLEVKAKLQKQLDKDLLDMRLVLLPGNTVMEDARPLSDLKVENDHVIGLCYRNASGDGEDAWEEVEIEQPLNSTAA